MHLPIRDGRPDDWPYIFDSFVTVYSQAPHARGASRPVLASLLEPVLRSWRTRVAVDPQDDTTIVGFVIHEPRQPRIAWVQVREAWRRKGVATALLADTGSVRSEVETPFMVQRIGLIKHGGRWESTGPKLTDVAGHHGITLRFRPYLPMALQLEQARAGAA